MFYKNLCKRISLLFSVIIILCNGYCAFQILESVNLSSNDCALACELPQLRAFPVDELIKKPKATIAPYMITLHRCDKESGCCTQGKFCHPTSTSPINITYRILISGKYIRESSTILNHTKCTCISRTDYKTSSIDLDYDQK